MPKKMKQLAAMMLCLLLVLSVAAPVAFASDPDEHAARQPDYSKTGSVKVIICTADDVRVGGGTLKMYQVALAEKDDDNNHVLVYTDGFADCGQDLDELEANMPAMAKSMEAWAKSKGLAATELPIATNGEVVFTNLALGLYLFVQDNPREGYSAVKPFLVTVPMWDGEKLVYDVLANPKPGTATGLACLEIEAKKVIKVASGTKPKNTTFTFRLTPNSPDQPMPQVTESLVQNSTTGALSLSRVDEGYVNFGEIWFGLEDIGKTYIYKLEELKGNAANFSYDSKIYTIQVTVVQENEGDALTLSIVCTDSNGKRAEISALEFVNVYDGGDKIPQTGQIWWPVTLMAGLGLVLFLLGWAIRRKHA